MPLKSVKKIEVLFKLFWCKFFVNWKFKLLNFLLDSFLRFLFKKVWRGLTRPRHKYHEKSSKYVSGNSWFFFRLNIFKFFSKYLKNTTITTVWSVRGSEGMSSTILLNIAYIINGGYCWIWLQQGPYVETFTFLLLLY